MTNYLSCGAGKMGRIDHPRVTDKYAEFIPTGPPSPRFETAKRTLMFGRPPVMSAGRYAWMVAVLCRGSPQQPYPDAVNFSGDYDYRLFSSKHGGIPCCLLRRRFHA
jgi:hypothetical protein